jgi:hypothetical protein
MSAYPGTCLRKVRLQHAVESSDLFGYLFSDLSVSVRVIDSEIASEEIYHGR